MAELLIALAIASLLSAGLTVGAITTQKSFIASRYHMDAQAQQMRLMDYMNLDLRRALTVNTEFGRLTLTIPDYYDSTGQPRDPAIKGGLAVYGSASRTIRYYKDGSTVFRSEGDALVALATDVEDFQMSFQDLGQSIRVSVTFLPKFQFDSKKWESMRAGTTSYTTTLLRNKRQY
jgi:hypothetical protein